MTVPDESSPQPQGEPLLETLGLTKHYGATFAADDVSLQLFGGSVHALIGENGAGKSTVVKMLTGLVHPTSGRIRFRQRELELRSPHQAMQDGIVAVHQELTLVDTMTVAENIWLGHEPLTRAGRIDFEELRLRSARLVDEVGLEVDLAQRVGALALARKQLVELLKALSWSPALLILDEATSSLGDVEVGLLERTVQKLRSCGRAIVFVSHRMPELFRFCDRCIIMRDGRLVHQGMLADLDEHRVVAKMTGRQATQQLFPPRRASPRGERILEVKGLATRSGLQNVTLDVHAGEILGVGGLQGHGQLDLLECLYGLRKPSAGEILRGGVPLHLHRPSDAQAAGIVFVPEDRKSQGLFVERSVEENIVACSHSLVSRLGILIPARVRRVTRRLIGEMSIKVPDVSAAVRSLSGGNQQKIALGRWLSSRFEVIVLVEPTRGIDVNTKVEIYKLLRQLADDGVAVVMSTNDLLELVGLCDRVLVMFERRIAGELQGGEVTEHDIIAASFGNRRRAAVETP